MSTVEAQLMDIPILPLRNRVLLPGSPLRLSIGRPASINLVKTLWDGTSKFKSMNTLIVIVSHRPKVAKEEDTTAQGNSQEGDLSVSIGPSSPTSSSSSSSTENNTSNLYEYGTLARVTQLQTINSSNAKYSMVVNGVGRVRIDDYLKQAPYLSARVTLIRDQGQPESIILKSLSNKILELASEILGATKTSRNGSPVPLSSLGATKQFLNGLKRLSPGTLADLLVSTLKITVEAKQKVLEAFDLQKRLEMTLIMMEKQAAMIKVTNSVQTKVANKLKSSQREYYLREQLKAIEEELSNIKGPNGNDTKKEENILEQLKNKLNNMDLPKEVKVTTDREIARGSKMNPAQPEHSIIVNYLQWMAELPWGIQTVDSLSIDDVQAQLDDDHYGLQKVKTRLVEFLAVRQLHERLAHAAAIREELAKQPEANDAENVSNATKQKSTVSLSRSMNPKKSKGKGPSTILCLVGPPGVGKTSLGTSVATALGRSFYRMALGGVHDEAELRGHRRTYIGAMPGNIIQGMKKAGTNNPVILLDEIDKMGRDSRGDPTAALLEILDPAQNHSFVDHYLNVPFDLSEVLFIATANSLDTIPGPLRDRMEIIQLPGYTLEEKMKIAKRHLLPKAIHKHALEERLVNVPDESLKQIITGYTREAGVRTMERQMGALCRRVAVLVAKQLPPLQPETVPASSTSSTSSTQPEEVDELSMETIQNMDAMDQTFSMLQNMKPYIIDDAFILDVLGPNIFESEAKLRVTKPGVATGMAWTQVGGELLFIECTQMPGSGRLIITGNVRDVMRESCQAALSWLKSNAGTLFASTFQNSTNSSRENDDDSTNDTKSDRKLVISNVMDRVIFFKKDLHIHFPAGAVPKDGPSAGCAITAALTSLWLDRNVRSDTSMTGEISLRGSVLPVGGIKSKVLAAHREGIRRVVLPKRNMKDARDIPEDVKKDLTLIFVDTIEELLDAVLDGGLSGHERADHLNGVGYGGSGGSGVDDSTGISAAGWNTEEKLLSNM